MANTRLARHFTNPIIPGFHPDPTICKVGRDFYLATSSFEYFPGVPIFHSRDLVNWRQLGHVLTRRSQLDLDSSPSSGGIYAPTLRYWQGRFYLVTTHVSGGGNFYVTAKHPTGPWSDPIWLDREGIDPSFLFADDTVYYTRNGRGTDFDHPFIHQTTVDIKKKKLADRMEPIWRGTGGIWPEGPHLFKIGGWYYLFAAEGGTGYGHSEVVARSQTPFGPFEPFHQNPILTHRDRPQHPIQALGHLDLVALDNGESWAVVLGIRPRGHQHHHLGRETFLAPVAWTSEGWPILGQRGRLAMKMKAPELAQHRFESSPARDDFNASKLDCVWNFIRNPERRDWSLKARAGFLRLRGSELTISERGSPAFVGRRQQHFAARCRALLDFAPGSPREEAGLAVRANENFHYSLAIRRGVQGLTALLLRRTQGESRVIATRELASGPLVLEIAAAAKRYTFRVGRSAQQLHRLGALETELLSAESIGGFGDKYFTGVFVGMYATGNGGRSRAPADFDWFEYCPLR